jgi:hypothetical protein
LARESQQFVGFADHSRQSQAQILRWVLPEIEYSLATGLLPLVSDEDETVNFPTLAPRTPP